MSVYPLNAHQLTSICEPRYADYFGDKPLWTPEIELHCATVSQLVLADASGILFWGLQNTGKTEFAKYLSVIMKTLIGPFVESFLFSFDGLKPRTDVEILARCLGIDDTANISRQKRIPLQNDLVDTIGYRCRQTRSHRVLLILDDSQNIPPALYDVFSSVVADLLRRYRIRTFLLSIGQPELRQTIEIIEQTSQLEKIGRFFPVVKVFKAMTCTDLAEFLKNMDGQDSGFSRRYFPARSLSGWGLPDLWMPVIQAIDKVVEEQSLSTRPRLPMRYLRSALNMMFRIAHTDPNTIIDAEVAYGCFENCGILRVLKHYVEPEDIVPVETQ